MFEEYNTEPVKVIEGWSATSKITNVAWGPLNETIITTGDDGHIVVFDARSGKIKHQVKGHSKTIRALAFDGPKQRYFATGSVDTICKVNLDLKKKYKKGGCLKIM